MQHLPNKSIASVWQHVPQIRSIRTIQRLIVLWDVQITSMPVRWIRIVKQEEAVPQLRSDTLQMTRPTYVFNLVPKIHSQISRQEGVWHTAVIRTLQMLPLGDVFRTAQPTTTALMWQNPVYSFAQKDTLSTDLQEIALNHAQVQLLVTLLPDTVRSSVLIQLFPIVLLIDVLTLALLDYMLTILLKHVLYKPTVILTGSVIQQPESV